MKKYRKCPALHCTVYLSRENELLKGLMSQPLSVYFDAYRTEVSKVLEKLEFLKLEFRLFKILYNAAYVKD